MAGQVEAVRSHTSALSGATPSVAYSRVGGQGSVSLLEAPGSPTQAVKSVPRGKRRAVAIEVAVARRMRAAPEGHAHITQVLSYTDAGHGDVQVAMEPGLSDLHDILLALPGSRCTEADFSREWFLQLAHALDYCHTTLQVAHRDVKPENVLLFDYSLQGGAGDASSGGIAGFSHAELRAKLLEATEKREGKQLQQYLVKLCDFGSALLVDGAGSGAAVGRSPRGSAAYACPEVCALSLLAANGSTGEATSVYGDLAVLEPLQEHGYDAYAADVWSWAVMTFTCVSGHLPFRTAHAGSSTFRAFVLATQPEALQGACAGTIAAGRPCWAGAAGTGTGDAAASGVWQWPAAMSPALVHLLQGCLRVDPVERWSMREVARHPWFSFPEWVPGKALGEEGGGSGLSMSHAEAAMDSKLSEVVQADSGLGCGTSASPSHGQDPTASRSGMAE